MTLFIRLDEVCEWYTSSSEPAHGSGSFEAVASAIKDISWSGDIVALIPGNHVLLTSAAVPSRQARQIVQALPYVVEEKLAVDVDECHFALGEKNAAGEFSVAINTLEEMRKYLSALDDIGVEPNLITVDTLLARNSDGTVVTIESNKAHIRPPDGTGICVSTDQLALAFGLIQQPGNVDIYGTESAIDQLKMEIAQIEVNASVTIHPEANNDLRVLADNYQGSELNLLQGEFRVSKDVQGDQHIWRSAAILAACTFVLHISLVFLQGIYLDVMGAQYEQEAKILYQDIFPRDRNIRDIRRRWNAHVSGSGSVADGEFLPLFRDTVAHLPGSKLVVNNINYNESRGDLILQLTATQSDHLVQFSQTLNKVGLDADIGTISQYEDSVRGSIKIRGFGGA